MFFFRKRYSYLGTDQASLDISPGTVESSGIIKVKSTADIKRWFTETRQCTEPNGEVIATFVVKTDRRLYIADRHAEHYVCASGKPVLSAGEIRFRLGKFAKVTEVTNLSTAYCPKPKSWKYVAKALKKAGLHPPRQFSTPFQFRKCTDCGNINVIKDNWYYCDICDKVLNKRWNL